MQGRIVPDAGGRETQADCSLTYKVSSSRTAGGRMGPVTDATGTAAVSCKLRRT